jgi:phage gp29-like protein
MAAEVVLYDAAGVPIQETARPPERIAEVGRTRDSWALREIRDIDAETLGRLARPDAPMAEQGALVQKILRDAHFLSVNRILINDAASLDWECQPAVKGKSWKSASAGEKKLAEQDAEFVSDVFYGIEEWDELLTHLLHGETFLTLAEIQWDDDYLPAGFELIDWRRETWNAQANQVRLLTARDPYRGEELTPNGFIVYRSRFSPGSAREAGLWRALVLQFLIKHYSVTDWLIFAEKFGKPTLVALYADEKHRPSVVETMKALSSDFAGVFPVGTEIDIKEAQRYGTINVFSGLQELADSQVTKLYLGHTLIADSQPGAGTLAGEGARKTNLKILRAVARRLGSVMRFYLARPLLGFHRGWDRAASPPNVVFKWKPDDDSNELARTFVSWNEALEPSGMAIDPEHIREQANVPKLVPRKVAAVTPPAPPPDKKEKKDAARLALGEAATRIPALADPASLERVTKALIAKAAAGLTDQILARIDAAPTIEAALDAVLEGWDEGAAEHEALGNVMTNAIEIAELTGRGDVRG